MSIEYKTILAAVDGSDESKRALNKAINVAKKNNGKLIITYVIDNNPTSSVVYYHPTLADELKEYANKLLDESVETAKNNELTDGSVELAFGSPKAKIPGEIAKKYNVDLIVAGAHGANAVERLLIGSVSETIVRRAKCDVLIVRDND